MSMFKSIRLMWRWWLQTLIVVGVVLLLNSTGAYHGIKGALAMAAYAIGISWCFRYVVWSVL